MKQMYSTSLAVINTESLLGSGGDVPSIQRETLENVYKKKVPGRPAKYESIHSSVESRCTFCAYLIALKKIPEFPSVML